MKRRIRHNPKLNLATLALASGKLKLIGTDDRQHLMRPGGVRWRTFSAAGSTLVVHAVCGREFQDPQGQPNPRYQRICRECLQRLWEKRDGG